MSDLGSKLSRILYNEPAEREYTVLEGNVAYLDGSALARPFKMPRVQRVIALVIAVAAIAIGLVFVNDTVLAAARQTAEAEQAVEANLARQASIETIPQMSSLINLGDDEIRQRLQESGYTLYDATETSESLSMVLYKLPADVSATDAAVMLVQGISSLSAAQASKLLNGSWYFAVDRNGVTSMVVRYADFSTGDPRIAVQNALAKEGIATDSVTESGVDDSGNTYSVGTLDADGTPCSWRISALPLEDMYSVSGLPEDACYVGVRVTVQ